jgi:hypothetical protein
VSSAIRGGKVLFRSFLTASLRSTALPSLRNVRTEFASINHTHCGHARCLVGSVSRTKVPGIRSLLCKSGLGLKLQGRIRNALISPVLSFDQVFGCTVLEQASRFETDGACVGMSSYVLDHGTPADAPDAGLILAVSNRRLDFRAGIGQGSHMVNRHFSVGRSAVPTALPSPPFWLCRRWEAASRPVPQSACALSSAELMLLPLQCCGGARPLSS